MDKKFRKLIDNMPQFKNDDDARDYFLEEIEKIGDISDEDIDELIDETSKDLENLIKLVKKYKQDKKKK